MTKKHYIVAMHPDEETPETLEIVGPFETKDSACEWGERWQEANGDNPCWQYLSLPDTFEPKIIAPY